MDNKFNPIVDIIMPTYMNYNVLNIAVVSLLRNTHNNLRLFVVNNHERPIAFELPGGGTCHYVHQIHLGENHGWMGGINKGIEVIKKEHGGLSKYVMFINDDIRILDHHSDWLSNMIKILERYPEVGAVGPSSNRVLYLQSLEYVAPPLFDVDKLSGFCLLTRASIIDEIGGLDESLFGGDDLDYSIRLRDAGYTLVCCKRSFVYHNPVAQTGRRLHKDWDSQEWTDKINRGLIQKHGFKKYQKMLCSPFNPTWLNNENNPVLEEMKILRKWVGNINGHRVLDMGCGGDKVHEDAVGVDLVPDGEFSMSGKHLSNKGVDVIADVGGKMPEFKDGEADIIIAKHVLEHVVDHVTTLKEWKRILKPGGRLMVCLPDPDMFDAINCDPTHVHAFNQQSIRSLLELLGFHVEQQFPVKYGWTHMTEAVKEGK